MLPLRKAFLSVAACGICLACGERPDLPGPAVAEEGSRGEVTTQLESQDPRPAPPATDMAPPAPPVGDAGAPSAAPDREPVEPAGPAEPAGDAPVFAACIADGGGCTVINVAVTDEAAESCIVLALDDCGAYQRGGLPIDVPVRWRVGSASVGDLSEECAPGEFDPDRVVVLDAAGSIGWDLATRRPSDLVIDVTLELPASAVDVRGMVPGSLADCP